MKSLWKGKIVDPIQCAQHYNHGVIEIIDFIEDQNLSFHRGNAVKYLCRAGRKSPETEVSDLESAKYYIQRDIDLLRTSKQAIKATSLVDG